MFSLFKSFLNTHKKSHSVFSLLWLLLQMLKLSLYLKMFNLRKKSGEAYNIQNFKNDYHLYFNILCPMIFCVFKFLFISFCLPFSLSFLISFNREPKFSLFLNPMYTRSLEKRWGLG